MGWGGAITFMSRPVHLKFQTPGLCTLHSRGDGGVGWGNNVHGVGIDINKDKMNPNNR